MNDAPHRSRERALGGLVVVLLVAGVLAALSKSPADDGGFQRAATRLPSGEVVFRPIDESAAGAGVSDPSGEAAPDTTPTSAVRVGDLDITSNAPGGSPVTLPELGPVDFADGATASAPTTGGLTDLISGFFGEVTVEALVIVQCESQFIPFAVGTNRNGTQDHGLFQINDVHKDSFEPVTGVSWESGRYDPIANTTFARWLYDLSGWRPWTCRNRLASFN